MSRYTQLTQEQRYQIYAFLKARFSQTEIANEIGAHKSTISRELKRNRGKRGYRSKQAHIMALDRRRHAQKFVKLTPPTIALIDSLIQLDFSPEQVSGSLKRNHDIRISHETIYQHVLADKARGGTLIDICGVPIKNERNAMDHMIAVVKFVAVSVSMNALL